MINFLTFTFSDFLTAIHVIFVVVFWLVIFFFSFVITYTAIQTFSFMIFAKRTGMKPKRDTLWGLFVASWGVAWRGFGWGTAKYSNNYWQGIGDWRYYDFKKKSYVYGIFTKKKTGEQ